MSKCLIEIFIEEVISFTIGGTVFIRDKDAWK